jgi:hypothetical protein
MGRASVRVAHSSFLNYRSIVVMGTLVSRVAGAVLVTGVLLTSTGCSQKDNVEAEVAAMNTSNILRLCNMYAAFQNYKGRAPDNDAEFRTFIKDFEPKKLAMMGIDPNNLDAVFTSERDRKPFKIRFKVGGGRGSVDPVVFEQDGTNGTKQVAFTGGKVQDADAATYQQLWAGKPAGGVPPVGLPPGAPTGKE